MSLFFALKLNAGHAHPATVQHAHDTNAEGPRFDPLQKTKSPIFLPVEPQASWHWQAETFFTNGLNGEIPIPEGA